jgi:site-specific DNA-methyltransferase (adenine-specific)
MIELMQGDCLELMKELSDKSVDMILTDPPYGMNYQSGRRTVSPQFEKIKGDGDVMGWLPDVLDELHRVMKEDTAIYMFASWHNIDIFKNEFEKRFKLKNIIVWNKNNHGSGDLKAAYAPKYELILYGHKGRSLFREKRLPDVQNYSKVPGKEMLHPTEKPIDMLEVFIRNNSDPNHTILDPFMGSGTTGVACKNLNRNFIGMELDETYFNIAKDRIENHVAVTEE